MANRITEGPSGDVLALIKDIYHSYRHTVDLDHKGLFFSPTCLQMCRPIPSYAATTREEIVQYLRDAQKGIVPVEDTATNVVQPSAESTDDPTMEPKGSSVYTIRPLQPSEFEFGTEDMTAPIGLTPNELKRKAEQEHWIAMRVDLWDEGRKGGLLVKVQYWWRFEEVPHEERKQGAYQSFAWRQCLHDIMYLGPKDGTEEKGELEILE